MTLGVAFWILMLLWFVFGMYWAWPLGERGYGLVGGNVLLFILLALLGWHAFGPPIHGG